MPSIPGLSDSQTNLDSAEAVDDGGGNVDKWIS